MVECINLCGYKYSVEISIRNYELIVKIELYFLFFFNLK